MKNLLLCCCADIGVLGILAFPSPKKGCIGVIQTAAVQNKHRTEMKMKIRTILLGAAIAPLFIAHTSFAQFIEVGDAPETIAGAQPTGTTGAPLTSISGSFNAVTDADLYRIFINNPATFSATTANSGTGMSIDTQLFLFTLDGFAIYMNDNEGSGASVR